MSTVLVEPGHNCIGCARIGRQRNSMNVANAHQGRDIRLVRLSSERVAEEDDGHDFPFGHARANHQVASFRAVSHALHLERQFPIEQVARAGRGDERIPLEQRQISPHKVQDGLLLLVMGDEGNHRSLPGFAGSSVGCMSSTKCTREQAMILRLKYQNSDAVHACISLPLMHPTVFLRTFCPLRSTHERLGTSERDFS